MKVYALVGRSGTGKSHKAQMVAGMHDIEYILDDGLIIRGTKVLAGVSAKREGTRIGAVKRAIYANPEHRSDVKKVIQSCEPDKILVIGTSEHMIQNIMHVLGLGKEYELIRIEDISEPEEIEAAIKSRRIKGKHVIPVPTFEVKKDFSGYFIDSIKQLVRKNEKSTETYEKTVVRPTFSYLGKYEIKDMVLKSIVSFSGEKLEYVSKVVSVDIGGMKEGIIITVGVILEMKEPLHRIAANASQKIKESLEYMTGKNVLAVNIVVKGVKIDWE
jgi:uncharacterized alkaline shock family protein YloU